MSSITAERRYTPQEYLELERAADHKSEYFNGRIYSIAGATEQHNVIASNLVIALGSQFKGRTCRVYGGDMKVKIGATGLYTYPDVSAVRDGPRFEDDRRDVLLNPTVIIEVLSKTTEAYDRGDKFAHYRQIETLQEYVLVSQNTIRVERFIKQPDGWSLSDVRVLGASLNLISVDCRLDLHDIYDKVDFTPGDELRPA